MLQPEEWMTIKTLSRKGVSQRKIARMLGISRNTVKRQLAEEHPPQYRRSVPYPSILDEYKDYLLERLKEYPTLTANRLYRELQRQGYNGSYETVVIFARKHRVKKDPQAYERFETSPGQQAQVDWGECSDRINHFGVRRKVYLFSMTLGFSRVQYIEFTLDMKMPTLMRCLLFQLVSHRYERGAMIVTTNVAFSEWDGWLGDPVMATAILDRLLHHATTVPINGESYRIRRKKTSRQVKTLSRKTIREPERWLTLALQLWLSYKLQLTTLSYVGRFELSFPAMKQIMMVKVVTER